MKSSSGSFISKNPSLFKHFAFFVRPVFSIFFKKLVNTIKSVWTLLQIRNVGYILVSKIIQGGHCDEHAEIWPVRKYWLVWDFKPRSCDQFRSECRSASDRNMTL